MTVTKMNGSTVKLKKIDVERKKVEIDNSVIECGKSDKILITLKKMTCLGVLE